MDMIETTISSEYKFKGKILNLRLDKVSLPDGSVASREIIEHNGGVGVLALDENGFVQLVRQYRHPNAEVIYEIPAGKLEAGEDPLECGKRELYEETGCTAKNWYSLGKIYPTPAYCGEIIHIFLATDISRGESHLDDGELLCTHSMPLDKALEMVLSGEICDAKTQIALMKLKLKLEGNDI